MSHVARYWSHHVRHVTQVIDHSSSNVKHVTVTDHTMSLVGHVTGHTGVKCCTCHWSRPVTYCTLYWLHRVTCCTRYWSHYVTCRTRYLGTPRHIGYKLLLITTCHTLHTLLVTLRYMLHTLLVRLSVKYFNWVIDKLWLPLSDLCAESLREISPDVIICGWLGLKHQLTN